MISSRDSEALAQTASVISEETGAEVDYRAADLTNAADIEALVAHDAERFGAWTGSSTTPGDHPQALSRTSTTARGRRRSSRSS